MVTRGTALESAGCVEVPTIISLPVLSSIPLPRLPILPQRPTWLHLCGRRPAWTLLARIVMNVVDAARTYTPRVSWEYVSDVRGRAEL